MKPFLADLKYRTQAFRHGLLCFGAGSLALGFFILLAAIGIASGIFILLLLAIAAIMMAAS
jgi:hypothetical protein